jgi:hypothetical protein
MITRRKARSLTEKIACQGTARANKITIGEEGVTRRQVRYHYPEPSVFIQVVVLN